MFLFAPILALSMEMRANDPHPTVTNVVPLKKPVEAYLHDRNVALHQKLFARYVISTDGRELYATVHKNGWASLPQPRKDGVLADLQTWWRTVCYGKMNVCTAHITPDETTAITTTQPAPASNPGKH